ncbi:uncharacterized protein F5Z01DRAFT_637792 [Emericellopsis atlantica]|uniref:Uncharacterized protein n=1 Tax=Emericellopsis atlantica TaxID=2614577 RepID=A0A9P7ZJ29_9HYPO|nr:uncharacterized protein F5Z01DRAFT_637792 [Emericellopsis atlantica]KAG9253039.1 hypothetical protein F5Z01DRAFT_637792 [Emericellopsis atlantica]
MTGETQARDAYYPLGITFVVLNTIACGLRLWVRILKRALGYDDLALGISFIGFVVFVAMELVAIQNGIGLDPLALEPHQDPITAAKKSMLKESSVLHDSETAVGPSAPA